ncbi:DUF5816 domain-containing protein [Halomarina pelagica]|uniref:DUF5816 domain-containing protein n=1 Tax=Halomarina pelagica TaxID=2961599 RepID=UPI0020C27E73|nr:DUF5816 domain-containing protein [Halomarina sp. BND7]
MEARTHPDGTRLFVDRGEPERGSKGPFYVVYRTDDGERRWGFFCSNCETFDTAVDSMGRIQCNVCSNLHKAEEWDAAHE